MQVLLLCVLIVLQLSLELKGELYGLNVLKLTNILKNQIDPPLCPARNIMLLKMYFLLKDMRC